jgi:hypothetical protein
LPFDRKGWIVRNVTEKQRGLEITSGDLAVAVNSTDQAIRRAVARGAVVFAKDSYRTPGGHLRWKPAAAAAIVRELGLEPPKAWEQPTGATKHGHKWSLPKEQP